MSLEAGSKAREADAGTSDFAALLKQSIDSVNDTQQMAGKMAEAFETGDANVSLAEVMVASQKASVSFQAMAELAKQNFKSN